MGGIKCLLMTFVGSGERSLVSNLRDVATKILPDMHRAKPLHLSMKIDSSRRSRLLINPKMVTKVACEPKHILLIRILSEIIKEMRQEVARIHAVSSVTDRNPTGALPPRGAKSASSLLSCCSA